MKLSHLACCAVAALTITAPAAAQTFVVDAMANSSSGGAGLASVALIAGQTFTISSSTDDLWSAGPLPRYSDANGLTGDRWATATDDSGQAVGTQIGANFGLWSQNSLSAAYGSLVGELNGVYMLLGANGSFVASSSGTLNLYYWDSNNGDNFGTIAFDISAVPEPAAWGMMIGGFGLAGMAVRRRRVTVAFA
ncbi:PEPxxWA-CTERM sorting domain-containing protein [Sphingomonas sp. JC676]|uniref:PEPxxWA-CTERM sorting domain-containing protein n=1 Tax=Sphingomonas sp. JC676 TaxID=2768065 RepID=UPI00292A5AA5|nr:PEPxxWA-CTERM sorting domain-containing protein [Sphingomonas sp. JC676]